MLELAGVGDVLRSRRQGLVPFLRRNNTHSSFNAVDPKYKPVAGNCSISDQRHIFAIFKVRAGRFFITLPFSSNLLPGAGSVPWRWPRPIDSSCERWRFHFSGRPSRHTLRKGRKYVAQPGKNSKINASITVNWTIRRNCTEEAQNNAQFPHHFPSIYNEVVTYGRLMFHWLFMFTNFYLYIYDVFISVLFRFSPARTYLNRRYLHYLLFLLASRRKVIGKMRDDSKTRWRTGASLDKRRKLRRASELVFYTLKTTFYGVCKMIHPVWGCFSCFLWVKIFARFEEGRTDVFFERNTRFVVPFFAQFWYHSVLHRLVNLFTLYTSWTRW